MKSLSSAIALIAAASVVACSGGGGSGSSTPSPTPTPTPTPTPVGLSLSPTSASAETREGAVFELTFDAQVTGDIDGMVVPDIEFDEDLFELRNGIEEIGNNAFRVVLTPKAAKGIPGGRYSGQVTFRLCETSSCVAVYPDTTKTFAYEIDAKLKPWTTHQRDAAHTGYVHTSVNLSEVSLDWIFTGRQFDDFTRLAADDSAIYISESYGVGKPASVAAISQETGALIWRTEFDASVFQVSAPAIAGDKVIVTTAIDGQTNNAKQYVLQARTGNVSQIQTIPSTRSPKPAPVSFGNDVYLATGYFEDHLLSFPVDSQMLNYDRPGSDGTVWEFQTPAVDEENVYFYTGNLDIFERETGVLKLSINDPYVDLRGGGYNASPIIADDGNIIAFSGSQQIEAEYSSAPSNNHRAITSFDPVVGDTNWSTSETYQHIPAIGEGMLYAMRNQPFNLDAIDLGTGAVIWRLIEPTNTIRSGCNIVVTDTHVFFGTNYFVYAVDLQTKDVQIIHDYEGCLAVTPNHQLIVVENRGGAIEGRIVAYNLRD